MKWAACTSSSVYTDVRVSPNWRQCHSQLLGTLDSNKTVSYVDLSGNFVDDRLMDEIDAINEARGGASPESALPPENSKQAKVESPSIDMSKPPMHEVPEESESEVAKRKAIMAVMRDNSIPWQEKNQRILQLQQQFYVPKDENDEQPQAQAATAATNEGDARSFKALIDRIFDDDRKLKKVDLDGQELGLEDQKALFEALSENSRVTHLSLVNCKIGNEGASDLLDALTRNSTLTYINLQDNEITSNAALEFISVLKQGNETLQYLELKDNRVRTGLLSQINSILEKRRDDYSEPEPVGVAASVSTASYSYEEAAPARASKSGSKSSSSRSGDKKKKKKSKSKSSRDRAREASI